MVDHAAQREAALAMYAEVKRAAATTPDPVRRAR